MLKKTIIILVFIFLVVMLGTIIGFVIYDYTDSNYNTAFENNMNVQEQDIEIVNSIEISNHEERTTPNTLMVYKTYFTKCKHYTQEYKDIDTSLVNLMENELKERCREWDIDKFTSEEVEMSREKEEFCGEHYRIKLENNAIVIYNIDENGIETEYEHTGITTEYLTEEDILKLTSGIYVYGKENLTSTIEDYE